jgi:hypothetical protein
MDIAYAIQTRLIGLRRPQGPHSGENTAQVVIKLLEEYEIADKLGYFVLDNAPSNDICVNEILSSLRTDILPRERPKR